MAKKTNFADSYEVVCADELRRLRAQAAARETNQPSTEPAPRRLGLLAVLGLLAIAHAFAGLACWLLTRTK